MKDNLVTLGELDHAIDDVLGFLQETEAEMQQMDDIYGDPKCIESYLKKIHVSNLVYLSLQSTLLSHII